MNGHSEWYGNRHGSQGIRSSDPAMNRGIHPHSQGHAPDAVYEAQRLFAAYPSASATPSAHGTVVCSSMLSALTRMISDKAY